jgi:hypothetical protein
LTSEALPKVWVGSTHRWTLARHWPGSSASHSCGTASMAVPGSRSPNPVASMVREKVQVTNSVCSSQRMRKGPTSIRMWVDCASGCGRWWSRSSAATWARLASRSAASPSMTTCDIASGAFMASGGRAWISLCNAVRCGWLFFSCIVPSKPVIVTQ